MNATESRVVCAAMLMDDGLIVTGVRHFSPDMRATLRRIYGSGLRLFGRWFRKPYHLRVKEQGFIDSRGNFLSRKEAWKRAESNGQIFIYNPRGGGLIPLPPRRDDEPIREGAILFSENLY